MRDLRQISVIGLGLLGGSITLGVLRSLSGVKAVGYTHRAITRRKAKQLLVATEIVDDIKCCVADADIVILATPISIFDTTFRQIADALPKGCIVTDVGSTKTLPHRWAAKRLPKGVHYVGSHPIAGSEQRGVEFARDDLFEQAVCILTTTKNTNQRAVKVLKEFWSAIGCSIKVMGPAEHDKIFANVSHLPHVTAAALINASKSDELKFAGKGFIDTTRIASGPSNIWADILMTNPKNTVRGIDKVIKELSKLQKAIDNGDEKKVEGLLTKARDKRATMINSKIKKKELLT